MKQLYILVIGLFLCYTGVRACSCVQINTFCETIYGGTAISPSYLIVHAKVKSIRNNGMDADILDILFGEAPGSRVSVRKGNGADCGVNTDVFEEGKEYLFALWEWNGEYGLSICGVSWLNVQNGVVRGEIAPGINRIDLDEFREIPECGGIGSVLATLEFTPNPAYADLLVQSSVLIEQPIAFTLYDITGRRILQEDLDLSQDAIGYINVRDISSGIYVLVVEVNGIIRSQKVVVQHT